MTQFENETLTCDASFDERVSWACPRLQASSRLSPVSFPGDSGHFLGPRLGSSRNSCLSRCLERRPSLCALIFHGLETSVYSPDGPYPGHDHAPPPHSSFRLGKFPFFEKGRIFPVKLVVVVVKVATVKLSKYFSEMTVIWGFFKIQVATVVEVFDKLFGVTFAKFFNLCGDLDVADSFVLLFFGVCLQPLPGKGSFEEVHQNESEGFQVIPATLFMSTVSVDRGVSCRSCQTFIRSERDVASCSRISKFFR